MADSNNGKVTGSEKDTNENSSLDKQGIVIISLLVALLLMGVVFIGIVISQTAALRSDMAKEFRGFRSHMAEEFRALRSDIKDFRSGMTDGSKAVRFEIKNFRSDMSDEFRAFRSEMKDGFGTVHARFDSMDAKLSSISGRIDHLYVRADVGEEEKDLKIQELEDQLPMLENTQTEENQ